MGDPEIFLLQHFLLLISLISVVNLINAVIESYAIPRLFLSFYSFAWYFIISSLGIVRELHLCHLFLELPFEDRGSLVTCWFFLLTGAPERRIQL